MKKTTTIKTIRPGKYADQARQVFLAFRGSKFYSMKNPSILDAFKNHYEMQKENQ